MSQNNEETPECGAGGRNEVDLSLRHCLHLKIMIVNIVNNYI